MAKKFGKRGKKKGAPEDPRNMFGPPMPRRGGPPASSTPLADFLDRGWPGVDDGYVVLPRSLAEAMSLPWQQQTAELLSQFHGTHRGLSWPIYRVTPSRYERLVDLDEEQLAEAGYLVEIDFDGEMVYRERSGRRVENPEQTTVLVATLDPIVRRRPPAQPRPQTPAEGGSRAPVPMNLPPAPVWRTVPAKSSEAPPLPVPEPPKNVAAPPGSAAPKKLPWEPVAKPPAAEPAAQPTFVEPSTPPAGPSTAESPTPPASTPAAESPWRATQSPWQAAMPSTAQPPVAGPQVAQPPVPAAQAPIAEPIAEPEVPKPPAAEAPVSPPLVAEPEVPVSPAAPAGASAAQPPFAESPAAPPPPAEPSQSYAAEPPAPQPPAPQPSAPQPSVAETSAPQPPAAEPLLPQPPVAEAPAPQPPAAEPQRAAEPGPPVAEQPQAEAPPQAPPQQGQESAVSTSGRLPVVPPSTARLVTELDEPFAVPSPVVEVDPDTDTPPRGTRLPLGGDRGWFDELPDSASAASSSEPPAPPEDTGFGPSGDPTEIPYRYRK
ncbi:hypothetical protein [Amycolatopsis magusensis]|uniref:hypothetical protein n=1 Tax=Amycolatopsis magusensis TaxID=882444 RepID=UPI0024A82D45|nr:hypothetical protein [Amycolatopsis magusensis]MDI5976505.1 hypothetical protein [Amycolatopsis magusensis]